MKDMIGALCVLFISCGGIDVQPSKRTTVSADRVCAHFSSCAARHGNEYDVIGCRSDVREIESECTDESAEDVKSCLLSTSCYDNPRKEIEAIFSCYGSCVRK